MDNRALTGIVIDPGHGGNDPGALGNGIVEKDMNLQISKYMYDRFKELGVPVSITRSGDTTLSLSERSKKAQSFYGTGSNVVIISNHINAGGGDGAEVIYALRNNSRYSDKILEELEKEGQNIRKAFQQRLPSNPSKDYYHMQRETPNNETVTVEYGFLDSPKDDPTQLKNNWKKYAEAVVRATASHKGFTYKAPGVVTITPTPPGEYYIVVKGDSLWSIATKFGLTVDELKALNNLSSNTLQIGQTLKIKHETTAPGGNTYVVKSGDSLWKIANNFGITVNDLKNANNLKTDTLQIGQVLVIPGGTTISEEKPITSAGEKYVVVKGDNLYSIANKYGVTVDDIIKFNKLTTNVLQIDQVLTIPGLSNYATYTVVKGDSLWKIANDYNTTVNNLKTINNLKSDALQIGQELLVPSK